MKRKQVSGRKKPLVEQLIFWLMLIAGTIFHLTTFHEYHNWGPDFAKYIGQAISLVDGYSFLDYFKQAGEYPGFPWGFPLLLAPVYFFRGFDLISFKIIVTAFFLAALPVIFYLFKDKVSSISRYFIIALFLLSPWFFSYKNNILSDSAYLFFTIISIYFMQLYIIKRKITNNAWVGYLLIGIFVSTAIIIRTQGFILVPTLAILQILKSSPCKHPANISRKQLLLGLIPYVVIALVYTGITMTLPQGNDAYWSLLIENLVPKKILSNVQYYLLLPSVFFGEQKISLIAYGISIPFFLHGVLAKYKDEILYLVYSILSLGLLIIWPFQQGLRFIISLMPFYFFFVFAGAENMHMKLSAPRIKITAARNSVLLIGIILLMICGTELIDNYRLQDQIYVDGPYTQEAQEAIDFISNETSLDAVIMFRKPPVISLFAHRQTIRDSENTAGILEGPANYFIYHNSLSNRALLSEIQEDPKNFSEVFNNRYFQIFKIIR